MAQSALRALTQQLMQSGPAPSGMASYQTAVQNAVQRPQNNADMLGGLPFSKEQAAYLAAQFAPGAAMADASGMMPSMPEKGQGLMSTAQSGQFNPSIRQNLQQGNYLDAALQGLGAVGDAAYAIPLAGLTVGNVLKAPRAIDKALDMSQAARMQRAMEQGYTGPYYHGSSRMDRVVETGQIDPRRATSGPMPYFTDNPALASSYATNKSDTSLPEATVQDVFRVSPKDLGISGRAPITVEQSWNFLDKNTKDEIRDRATRIGYENFDEASGPLTLHPSGTDASPSKSQYEYLMRTTAKGNPLAALRELWVDSGNLFNQEEKLADVYRLAGFPAPIDQSLAPWTEGRGVLPAMLRLENPLSTNNTTEIVERVIPALESAFKNSRARTAPYGADIWDKNTRYTPKQWVEQLKQDSSKSEQSFVWTSIPDKVTEARQNLGYDGILDQSGKMGGEANTVAIPFRKDQVRSVYADFDPAKRGSANLSAGIMGGAVGLSALRQLMPQQEQE